MNKNILFSLALCALLLPQGFFASQSWSEWGMQGLKNAAETVYSYLPSGSSLSNWATNLVNSMSDEQKNYLRVALGMGAVATAGYGGYKYHQSKSSAREKTDTTQNSTDYKTPFTPIVLPPFSEQVQQAAINYNLQDADTKNLFGLINLSNIKALVNNHAHNAKTADDKKIITELFKQYVCPVLTQFANELENEENWKKLVDFIIEERDQLDQRKRKLDSLITLVLSCNNEQLALSSRRAFIIYFSSIKLSQVVDALRIELKKDQKTLESEGVDNLTISFFILVKVVGNYNPKIININMVALEKIFEQDIYPNISTDEFKDINQITAFTNTLIAQAHSTNIPKEQIVQSLKALLLKVGCKNVVLLAYLKSQIK